MSRAGYCYLAAGQYPGAEPGRASQLELIQSLGILTTPPDGVTGH